MSQRGNKCPGLREFHTFESRYCLDKCESQCVPASVLVQIEHKMRTDKHFGDYVSATALLGCLRQLALERTIDYYVEPPQNWYSIRGTLLHTILENPDFEAIVADARAYVYRLIQRGEANREDVEARWIDLEARLMDFSATLPVIHRIDDWQSETEYEMPLGWWCRDCKVLSGTGLEQWTTCPICASKNIAHKTLKGTIDVLRPKMGKMLDYKTIGDKGLAVVRKGAKQDHIMQFNIYRLLAERGYPKGESYATYKPVKITSIDAYYMTMMQVLKTGGLLEETTEWRVSDLEIKHTASGMYMNDSKLADAPVLLDEKDELVTKKGKRKNSADPNDFELSHKRKWKITYAVPDVPLMNLDTVEGFVRENAPLLFRFFEDGTLPPMCGPEMRQWKCEKYCATQIREACDKHNESVGVSRIVQIENQPETVFEAL